MDRRLSVGLKPKKRLGQNFLVDEEVVADLVSAAEVIKQDVVIEVGAGTGVVTKELVERAGKVFAFEIDRDLIPVLKKQLANPNSITVKILNQDFLKLNNSSALCSDEEFTNFKIVGSVPYQITSPLLHKLLTFEPKPLLVVLLIQKEVAEKIMAQPPKATYLSNTVKLLGEVEIVRSVPKTAFWPAPAVDGAIIKIVCSRSTLCCLPEVDIGKFQKFLHQGFQSPRKMLRTKFDPEVLKSAGIDPTQRAQRLKFDEWLKLYMALTVGTSCGILKL